MSDWTLYTVDLLEGLYVVGAAGTDGVNDSGATSTAVDAVDLDQTTAWLPGSGSAKEFRVNLPTARSGNDSAGKVIAVGLGNVQNITSAINAYTPAAFDTGVPGTSKGNVTPTAAARDYVFTITESFGAFWRFIVATTSASSSIGSIALLTTAGRITLSGIGTPRYSIGRSMSGGVADVQLAGGSSIAQTIGGITQDLTFTFWAEGGDATKLWETIAALVRSTRRFSGGVWIVDDAGAAHYCKLKPGSVIQSAVAQAGPLYQVQLAFEELSYGVAL